MKVLPFFTLLLLLSVDFCRAQEDEGDDSDSSGGGGGSDGLGPWQKIKMMWKQFVATIQGLFRQMMGEIKARTQDINSWSVEIFNSFKQKMFEWVDSMNSAPESEKSRMREYIEKLQMPKDGEQLVV